LGVVAKNGVFWGLSFFALQAIENGKLKIENEFRQITVKKSPLGDLGGFSVSFVLVRIFEVQNPFYICFGQFCK